MLLKMKGKDKGGGDGGTGAAQNLLSDKPEGGILQGQYFLSDSNLRSYSFPEMTYQCLLIEF